MAININEEDIALIPQSRVENLQEALTEIKNTMSDMDNSIQNSLNLKANDSDTVHITKDEDIIGKKTFKDEIVSTSPNALRIKYGQYATIFRNDGSSFAILFTDKGNPSGDFNNLRPLVIDLETGYVTTLEPDINDSSNKIATTKFVKDNIAKIASTFIYEQGIPSAKWNITHNLNKYPSVTIVDSALSEVVGDIQYIDENNVLIKFSSEFSGKAFFN